MMRVRAVQVAMVFGSFLFVSPQLAQAAVSACGNAYVSASASCEFVTTQQCDTKCVPTATLTSCAAQLYVGCDTQCVESTMASCTESCTPVCVTECTTTQASTTPPNSRGLCMSGCQQDCNTACSGAADMGKCRASCAHNCDAKCEKHCSQDDATTVCADKCTSVCTGSCSAKSTSSCQIACQASGFGACETTVTQQCTDKCKNTGGAIFCDGQFLNATDLDACAAELASKLKINVDVKVQGSITTNGKTTGCSMSASSPESMPFAAMVLCAILLGTGLVRRRVNI